MNGLTPLHYAAVPGPKEIAELLLANRADVNARELNAERPWDTPADQEGKSWLSSWASMMGRISSPLKTPLMQGRIRRNYALLPAEAPSSERRRNGN